MNAFLRLMLKGSAVSAFALTMAAVGCSDADKDTETAAGGEDGGGTGGKASTAGSSNNGGDPSTKGGEGGAGATTVGGADAGGADAGGADAGGADAGGAGGAAAGLSVAKFCNDLVLGEAPNQEDTTLVLEVGTGADKVTFTATTGECVPADGVDCKSIPLGTDTPVTLFDADDLTTPLFEGLIDSEDGDKWIFNTTVETVEEVTDACDQPPCTFPIAEGNTVSADFTCEEITYDDVYPPQ